MKGTVHVTKSLNLCGQDLSLHPKEGEEVRHLPALVLNLPWKPPEFVRCIRLPCTDPPWCPHSIPMRVYGANSSSPAVQCARPKGSGVRTWRGPEASHSKGARSPQHHRPRGKAEGTGGVQGTQGRICHRRPVTDCRKPRQAGDVTQPEEGFHGIHKALGSINPST